MYTTELQTALFSDKADCLIAHGIRLFLQKGVQGTGVNEILAAAGMGKSQFYHYFENKDEFVCAVLRRAMDLFLSKIAWNIRTLRSLLEFDSWFEPYLALAGLPGNLGCPVGVIASEMSPSSPVIRRVACESMQRWLDALSEGLNLLKESQPLREDFQPRAFALHLASAIQGGFVLGRTLRSLEPIVSVREQTRHQLTCWT